MEATGEFPVYVDDIVTHHDAKLDEVRLHYVEAGAPDGKLVVLLHGFPEFWYSWRHQIAALSEAGYRVVAPDQRGYNTSEKPSGIANYAVDKLTADIVQLIEHLGEDSAHVVGHDWGAHVAWTLAMHHPECVDKLAILNVPHPYRMVKGLRTLKQLRKSWYIFFFQLPGVAERLIPRNDWKILRNMLRKDPVHRDAFSEEDIDRYVAAMAQPGALKSAISWYRAAARKSLNPPLEVIEHPTLVIWGMQDTALGEELAEPPSKWVINYRIERIPDASHWVQCDVPDRVNAHLLHFLADL